MSSTDHLALARDYIAIAESEDSKREAYMKAADEIVAAQREDSTLSNREIGRRVGKSDKWVGDLVRWRTNANCSSTSPFADSDGSAARAHAKTALKDPEQRKQVLASLPAEQIEEVIQEAQDVAVERVRAQRAEHQTEPTTRDLMGGDKFNPAEYWADTLIIRLNRNARELASLIDRAGGLLFGTMPPEEAFDYLHESERLIAEARAAAQEQVRDRTAGV